MGEVESELELNLDGLVGPTHNFSGFSPGNLASEHNRGSASNPRGAALQGLAKMRAVASLGVPQGVLPPPWRPHVPTLRTLGFFGTDEQVLAAAYAKDPVLFRRMSSASSMWAANAATVGPSRDTTDGRVHFVPANLSTLLHRSIESTFTERVLRSIFSDSQFFEVHAPLPQQSLFADEGAANHTRLVSARGAAHLFAWGRTELEGFSGPSKFPARQSREASAAVARLLHLEPSRVLFPQQDPRGIDAGAFHSDVVMVGQRTFLMAHEFALLNFADVCATVEAMIGEPLVAPVAMDAQLPIADAVAAYPFNSQVLATGPNEMVIVAPSDSEENPRVNAFFDRLVHRESPFNVRVVFIDVRQSMRNGGGPACLRLRVPLRETELSAMSSRVRFDARLDEALVAWVSRHYRDRLEPDDLGDPSLHREIMTALDELSGLLALGSVYEFQTP